MRSDDKKNIVLIGMPGVGKSTIYGERHPLYLKYADHTVETGTLTADQVVGQIFRLLKWAGK